MLVPSQASIGTAATFLTTVPPGAGSVTFTVAAAATVFVYLGASNTVTTTNGAPVTGGQSVTIPLLPGQRGQQIWAVASAAATPVGVIYSTAG